MPNSGREWENHVSSSIQLIDMPRIQRALLSVTDKTGIVDFGRCLAEFSVELISTGGTAKLLREAGVSVRDVSEVTGFPEMLDGRVKTMDPRISGGILAVRSNADHLSALDEHDIPLIDMVVVNLYAFEKVASRADASFDDKIENIDLILARFVGNRAQMYQVLERMYPDEVIERPMVDTTDM